MARTLAIGDIHGGLRALKQVLERAGVAADDTLVFLGDYVDGWSESSQTINYVMDLSQQQSCIFIKGNHDVWCEEWLRSGASNNTWLYYGGEETVESYTITTAETRARHLQFFEAMPFYYTDEHNRLFIHAGFTSAEGPQHEFDSGKINWDRTLWETAVNMNKKYLKDSLLLPKRMKLYHEIYIGHTPTLYYDKDVPMQGCNVWNIDTGAAFTGKLTLMDISTKKFWQSDPVQNLYPGETGRNSV